MPARKCLGTANATPRGVPLLKTIEVTGGQDVEQQPEKKYDVRHKYPSKYFRGLDSCELKSHHVKLNHGVNCEV
jgi:hypothetical protein